MRNDPPLILKRSPVGDSQDDYAVLENGVVVGRIFTVPTAPQGRPWMWASGHNGEIRRAAHGYEPTQKPRCRRSPRAGGGSRLGQPCRLGLGGAHIRV
jgi:hypothetical protein